MPAANTRDVFREFVGQKLIGLLFDAMPASRSDLKGGNAHLIFEDGRALTLCSNGSYWIDSAEDVKSAVKTKERALRQTGKEIEEVLQAAKAVA